MSRFATFLILAVSLAWAVPDFSGRWRLVEQETSAFMRRGKIGQLEGPIAITQDQNRLSASVEPADPSGTFTYDLTGAVLVATGPTGERVESRSRWEGATLVTKGRRAFTTPDGVKVFDFTEKRRLSGDGRRMEVETTIEMWPRNLVRKSVYERLPDS